MSGHPVPSRPDRVIHRFQAWSLMPAQDLLTLHRSLLRAPAAESSLTAVGELLSIVEEEVERRGLRVDAGGPGTLAPRPAL